MEIIGEEIELNKPDKKSSRKPAAKSAKKSTAKKHTKKPSKKSENINGIDVHKNEEEKFREEIKKIQDRLANQEKTSEPEQEKPEKPKEHVHVATPIIEDHVTKHNVSLEDKLEVINKSLKSQYAKLVLCLVALGAGISIRVRDKSVIPKIIIDIALINVTMLLIVILTKIVMLSNAKQALTGNGEYIIESLKLTKIDKDGRHSTMEYTDPSFSILNMFSKNINKNL